MVDTAVLLYHPTLSPFLFPSWPISSLWHLSPVVGFKLSCGNESASRISGALQGVMRLKGSNVAREREKGQEGSEELWARQRKLNTHNLFLFARHRLFNNVFFCIRLFSLCVIWVHVQLQYDYRPQCKPFFIYIYISHVFIAYRLDMQCHEIRST